MNHSPVEMWFLSFRNKKIRNIHKMMFCAGKELCKGRVNMGIHGDYGALGGNGSDLSKNQVVFTPF